MDAKRIELEAELAEDLRRAAAVACRLQKLEQRRGTPRYDQIESDAHDVGQQLSRMVQQERTGELAAEQLREATCPQCRNKCPVTTAARQVTSIATTCFTNFGTSIAPITRRLSKWCVI